MQCILGVAPYSDFLLHDMGEGLADGRGDFEATGREWRTPPLWGIGLNELVTGHRFYLHDGRPRGLAESFLWHGGEAEPARESFRRMIAQEREALLTFLRSL
ncbi:MAG: di-heme oxidoredictase family protein [Guyparkeria sp.]